MGRSVSYPQGAEYIAYCSIDEDDDWHEFIGYFQDAAKQKWPSMVDCDRWIGREDRAICENDYAYLGVSEYCGLVVVWLLPKEESPLASNWCNLISSGFIKLFGRYRKISTASNGESFFEAV